MAPIDSAYPDDYRDPEWDGSEAEFRDIVLPSRIDALTKSLNEQLAPFGLSVEWQQSDPA